MISAVGLKPYEQWRIWWFQSGHRNRAVNHAFLVSGGRYICRECVKPAPEQVHASCRGFRSWIDRGGTLD